MTNILQLPQLSASFTLVNNSDWRDVILFQNALTGIPINLSGIDFRGQLRLSAADLTNQLEFSTMNGLLLNGAAAGTLTFAVPYTSLQKFIAQSYVLDLLAIDSVASIQINLFETAPAPVTMLQGVTR
jgi:hypothetical protein